MREIVEIYSGPDACQKCLGWRKIANDDDQTPWKYWAELPPPSNLAVQLGMVFPIDCPRCQGTGREPSAETRATRMEAALVHLQATWDALSSCVDEFEPSDMSACSEHRDALDTAIVTVLAAWKESS